MSDKWGSYFCNAHGKLASIALNLSLQSKVPVKGKPWLLWVWLYLQSPRADGLSSRAEFDSLSAMEDSLAERIGTACTALQAGRITTDGHREFYFYGATEN